MGRLYLTHPTQGNSSRLEYIPIFLVLPQQVKMTTGESVAGAVVVRFFPRFFPSLRAYLRALGPLRWAGLFLVALGLMLTLGLCLEGSFSPGFAQSGSGAIPKKAPVLVDGQELFRVSGAENFTAQERADLINTQLATIIESQVVPQVQVQERNASPVIVANNRYLLTVTEEDALFQASPSLQATRWAEGLQTALQQAYEERRPRYLRQALLRAGLILFGTIVTTWLLRRFSDRFLRQPLLHWLSTYRGNEAEHQEGLSQLLSFLLNLVQISLWVTAVFYLANLFPVTRQWSYRVAQALSLTFIAPWLNLGDQSYSIGDFLILLLLFWGLIVGTSTLTTVLRTRILNLTRMSRGAQEVVTVITRYSLIFFGTIVLLQAWGLDLSSLALLGGALGVGIGFGLQDIARDFSSGLVLLFERSIQAGDFIEVDTYMGTVERVGARSIVLRTLDRISIIVPNSAFINNNVINWSHDNPLSRLRLPTPVAYGSDVSRVRACLLQAASEHDKVMKAPAPQAVFLGYGDNALQFELFVWIAEPAQQLPITSDLYYRIEELFRQYKVTVPFPQRDLHVRSGSLPITLPPHLEATLSHWLTHVTPPPEPDQHKES